MSFQVVGLRPRNGISEPSHQNTIYERNHRDSGAACAKGGNKYLSCCNPTAHTRSLGQPVQASLAAITAHVCLSLLAPHEPPKCNLAKNQTTCVVSLILVGLCAVSMVVFQLLFLLLKPVQPCLSPRNSLTAYIFINDS